MSRKGVWDLQDVRDKHLRNLWVPRGRLFSWGSGSYGDGLGGTVDYSSPVEIPGDWCLEQPYHGPWSDSTKFAIKRNGTLWAWGRNSYGSNGDNRPGNYIYLDPIQVGDDHNWPTTDVQSKFYSAASATRAIKTDGTLWAWGWNWDGKLGQNSLTNYSSPVQVGTGTDWKMVSGLFAIKNDNSLWGWGTNQSGQLGQDDGVLYYSSPVQVPGIWLNVESPFGLNSTLAIKQIPGPSTQPTYLRNNDTEGELWTWGSNFYGRLGHGQPSPTNVSSPKKVGTEIDWRAHKGALSIGGWQSFAIRDYDNLYSWGKNFYGTLGRSGPQSQLPTNTMVASPVKVMGSASDDIANPIDNSFRWESVSVAYEEQVIARTKDGHLWTWGNNENSILGLNEGEDTPEARSSPVRIGTHGDWTSATSHHSGGMAVRSAVPSMKKKEL